MLFDAIVEAKPDAIFGLKNAFDADTREEKINLAVGVYKDDALEAHLMPSVAKAKKEIFSEDLLADYLPIDGLNSFCVSLGALLFGEKAWEKHGARIASVQAIGGTGALRIAGGFLTQEITRSIVIPDPTWPNHQAIFLSSGCQVGTYPYYDKKSHLVDFEAICAKLKTLEKKSAVLLHGACHNPTGADLTLIQWEALLRIIQEKELLPVFDVAYHGLGDGLALDAMPIDLFLSQGQEMLIAYSCSKNFSLYCQRVGALFVVTKSASTKAKVQSQLKKIVRALYSNPPAHGVRIVSHILNNPLLVLEWKEELEEMRKRLERVREKLVNQLGTRYQFLKLQKGMFSFLDLEKSQVDRLIEEYGIYLPDSGRIAIVALNDQNMKYVVDAISSV